MRKSKIKYISLLLLIIGINLFLVPLFELNNTRFSNNELKKNEAISLNHLSPLISNNLKTDVDYLNTGLESTNSILDNQLKEYLLDTSSFDEVNPSDIKIIVLFKSEMVKEERVSIIESIFKEYEILANYDIIPGIYLKINPKAAGIAPIFKINTREPARI